MIFRWTIGPSTRDGYRCLKSSIKALKKLYPDANCHVLYNQIARTDLDLLNGLDVIFHDQTNYIESHSLLRPSEGYQVHWKLFPLRLDIKQHEISIDNDMVIFKRIEELDFFLNNKEYTLLYQGLNGLHGSYDKYVPKGIRINSGIYGMPPDFDFEKELVPIEKWSNKFDEQGIVASTLLKSKYVIIPLTKIPILEKDFHFIKHPFCCGYHFVGLNYEKNHNNWRKFYEMGFSFL